MTNLTIHFILKERFYLYTLPRMLCYHIFACHISMYYRYVDDILAYFVVTGDQEKQNPRIKFTIPGFESQKKIYKNLNDVKQISWLLYTQF